MAERKTLSMFSSADARPRIYFRVRGDQVQAAGNVDGPFTVITDIVEAIDEIAGEGAYRGKAVLLWEGAGHDA